MKNKTALQRRIRFLLLFFILALAAAGLTAIPLKWELDLLRDKIIYSKGMAIHGRVDKPCESQRSRCLWNRLAGIRACSHCCGVYWSGARPYQKCLGN